MTREDIIRMARETAVQSPSKDTNVWVFDDKGLERFAALVAAAEREVCAQVCEARFMGDLNREDMKTRRCAAAIRARGEK